MKNYVRKLSSIATGTGLALSPATGLAQDADPHLVEGVTSDICGEGSLFYGLNKGSSLWRMTESVVRNHPDYQDAIEARGFDAVVGGALEAATQHTIEKYLAKRETSGLSPQEESNLANLMVDSAAFGYIADGNWEDRDSLHWFDQSNPTGDDGHVRGKDGWRGDRMYPGQGFCLGQGDLEAVARGDYGPTDVQPFLDAVVDRRNGEIQEIGEGLTATEAIEAYVALGLMRAGENYLEFTGGAFLSEELPEGLGGVIIELEGQLSLQGEEAGARKGPIAILTTDNRFVGGPLWGGVQGGLAAYRGVHGAAFGGETKGFRIAGGPVGVLGIDGIDYDGHRFHRGSGAVGGQLRFGIGQTTGPFYFDTAAWAALGLVDQNGEVDMNAAYALFGIDARADVRLSENVRMNAELELTREERVDHAADLATSTPLTDLRGKLGIDFQTDNGSVGPHVGVGHTSQGSSYFTVGVTGKVRK